MFRQKGTPADDAIRRDADFVALGEAAPVSLLGRTLVAIWAAGLVVIVAVSIAHVTIFGSQLSSHETQRGRERVEERVDLVVEPAITSELIAGDAAAYDEFDALIRSTVLMPDTAGLTLWTADGTVVYSLDRSYVGSTFTLPEIVDDVVRDGSVIARHGPLDGPGDESPPGDGTGSSVEVYAAVDGPASELLVWEADLRRDSVTRDARRMVWVVALMEAAGTAAILTAQGLFARSLLKRHDRERQYRRWLTQRSAETALVERRRIAADLHDGVVQDLTGLALDVAVPINPDSDPATLGPEERTVVAARLRAVTTSLRAQTAELYPIASTPTDLPTSLRALLEQVDERFTTDLTLDDAAVPPKARWLVFRVAQEAVRNATRHSHGTRISIEVKRVGHDAVLTVDDDGIGFSPSVDTIRPGHMGLSLLADMAAAADSSLTVRSIPGAGTTVKLEVPR
jgi:signal transduction histidine kinase